MNEVPETFTDVSTNGLYMLKYEGTKDMRKKSAYFLS